MSRTRIAPKEKETHGVVQELYQMDGEEFFAGAVVRSPAIVTFGNESKASISRVNPTGYRTTSNQSETSKYFHIQNAANPFSSDSCGVGAHESIELCQKAFHSFPSFGNPIRMQAYLANSPLHFVGKNAKMVEFYEEWYKKAQIWNVANQFFLEWFRSGNVFLYKFEGKVPLKEVKSLTAKKSEAKDRKIPLRYIILNPVDIRGLGSSSFTDQAYGKVLNAYEVEMLLNPRTEEDKLIYESLDENAKQAIREKRAPVLKLDPKRLITSFNAKQDYEPMSIPPYFGVLESINFKQILRSAETKVAASADYCILWITAGETGDHKRNNKVLQGISNMFAAQSVGRVIVADYTAEAKFVIPDFDKIFGTEKYENVDKDIINGMNDIMSKNENFASGQTKTNIYLQLLSQARESFLHFFLIPEMKKIAEEFGFTDIPDPVFEDVTLDSTNESRKLYNRLFELGALTPKDLFHAYETDQLPLYEKSLENQDEFKGLKKSEIYVPLIGGPNQEAGRPTGTSSPKTTNTVTPKGGKASLTKIKNNIPKMEELMDKVALAYKAKVGISRLSKKHKEMAEHVWEKIMVSKPIDQWDESVAAFIEDPLSIDLGEQYDAISELAAEHGLDCFSASILFHAQE